LTPLIAGEPAGASPESPERGVDVREYLYRLRRHWKLIAVCVVLATAAGAVHYVITPREYSAWTTIQIERRSLSVAGSQMAWLENWWNMEYYPTQHEILRSRRLAEEVIRKLRLMEDPKFNPGAAPGSAGDAEADRAALARMAQSLRSGLSVSPIRETQIVRLAYQSSDPEFAARVVNGFADTFIDLGVETRTVTVTQAQSFIDEQIEDLRAEIAGKEEERRRLGDDSDLVGLAPDGEGVADERLGGLNREFIDAKRRRIDAQSRYEDLVSTSAESVASTYGAGAIDPLQGGLRRLEQEYRSQLDTFRPSYPPMVELQGRIDQARTDLADAIEREARRIVSTTYRDYQAALRQESRLAQELERLKGDVLDQSSATLRAANLRLEIENSRELLDDLMRRQSETSVARRQQENRETNVHVIDRAFVPGSPAHPSLKKDLSMGLGAGFLLGLALVVLLEFLDRTIKNGEEAEKLLGLPVLAVIPDLGEGAGAATYGEAGAGGRRSAQRSARGRSGSARPFADRKGGAAVDVELVPHTKPRLAVSEGYRGLRTALLLSTADELKVVAVTSAGAGEGKTVTAANLAVVLAQLGRRVLLLDCDLRKPRLHRIFQLSNRQGVVTFLTGGRDAELAVYPTDVPGLFVTPSGPTPPNPSELLASDRMGDLVAAIRTQFDYVVLDTPPVLPVTDAVVAGALADGTVLCLRAGKVLRDEAAACRDRLRRADVKVLGTVLNGHRSSQGGAGKRYQYYETYAYAEEAEAEAGSAA
jgi:capsular exopolysaccharide synthesis family protein